MGTMFCVAESLEPFADELKVQRLKTEPAVRDGYSGMILAYGWRGNSDPQIPVC